MLQGTPLVEISQYKSMEIEEDEKNMASGIKKSEAKGTCQNPHQKKTKYNCWQCGVEITIAY